MDISAHKLDIQRGGVMLLSGLDFTLQEGEALLLKGPNGIGKTSLLRTMAGLQPLSAGRLEIDPDDQIYAAHADGLKATLSVKENLEFWAHVFGQNEIGPALDRFNLRRLTDRPAGSLSAGQKRRLGLARLLISGRRIWLLDEPTVSLDQASAELFAQAVKQHLNQGGIAVMATHIDLNLKARILDLSVYREQARQAVQADKDFL